MVIRLLLFFLLLLTPSQLTADTSIYPNPIQNEQNKDLEEPIEKWRLIEIFTLRKTVWDITSPSQIKIYLLDNRLVMNRFSVRSLDMPYRRYQNLIQSKIYQGGAKKPIMLSSSEKIIRRIIQEKNAIGVIREGIIISKNDEFKIIEVEH